MLIKTNVNARLIILEPGDHTKYKFIVSDYINAEFPNQEKDFLLIAGFDGPPFNGYIFQKSQIKMFFEEFGLPPKNKKDYRAWAELIISQSGFLGYVCSHTGMINPFTALAGIIAGLVYMDNSIIIGVEND